MSTAPGTGPVDTMAVDGGHVDASAVGNGHADARAVARGDADAGHLEASAVNRDDADAGYVLAPRRVSFAGPDTVRVLGAAIPRYLRRSYHPSQEGSLRKAVEYPSTSPAARAAAGAVGRAALRS